MDSQAGAKRIKLSIAALQLGSILGVITGITRFRTGIKSFIKRNEENNVFSFVLIDDSGEIRVSVFGKNVKEVWQKCANGSTVGIAGGTVKAANPQYNTTGNCLEMCVSLDRNGSICESNESITERPLTYSFRAIDELSSVGLHSSVDVMGIVSNVEMPSERSVRASGQKMALAKVKMVDKSNCSVSCSFWNESAAQVEKWNPGDIIAIKGAKTQEFANSLQLSCTSANVEHNPNMESADELKTWFKEATEHDTLFRSVDATHIKENVSKEDEFLLTLPDSMIGVVQRLRCVRMRVGNTEFRFNAAPAMQKEKSDVLPPCQSSPKSSGSQWTNDDTYGFE